MKKVKYLLSSLLLALVFLSCKKEEALDSRDSKVISLTIKGVVLDDSIEFVNKGAVIGTMKNTDVNMKYSLFNSNDKLLVRRKLDGKELGYITVTDTPFTQVRKIFYDGVTFSDNIQLTPVSKPENMGIRFRFSTSFADFYGGPVDVEIIGMYFDMTPGSEGLKYVSILTVPNVTAKFGSFVELESIPAEWILLLKVYKAGTKEQPYSKLDNVKIEDPETNYGSLSFEPGFSKLFSISPILANDNKEVTSGYDIRDFSYDFQ